MYIRVGRSGNGEGERVKEGGRRIRNVENYRQRKRKEMVDKKRRWDIKGEREGGWMLVIL